MRPDLEKAGHRYQTRCDTETILHAYEEYGPACVERFRGMFAFAIWDQNARKLYCARDRLGIKPFYYYWDGALFAFASEIKALLEHPAISAAFDQSQLAEYLAFGYTPMPEPYSQSVLPTGVRSRFVDNVNGLRVHVLEAGFGAGSRPCVLLLHGFPELSFSWRKVMGPLADAGFHVLAPDLRGYGRTTGWDDRYDTDLRSFGLLLRQGCARARLRLWVSLRGRSGWARLRVRGCTLVFDRAGGRIPLSSVDERTIRRGTGTAVQYRRGLKQARE